MSVPTIVVPQNLDTPLHEVREGAFRCRYAYLRGGESRDDGDLGQDAIVLRAHPDRLVFALCDGVGQSFCGELAASHLVKSLVDLLWNARGVDLCDEAAFSGYLQQELMQSTLALRQRLETHELPAHLPLLLRQELDKKRHHGSESTYVCGRLDRTAQGYSSYLSFMGDSRLRLWVGRQEQSARLGHRLEAKERWSSHRGPLAVPGVYIAHGLPTVRLVAYSDGFDSLDGSEHPDAGDAEDLMAYLRTFSGSDDASYVEVDIQPA